LVRKTGRGRDEKERSLEMTEVSREGGRRWCRQESGLQILWKKDRESLVHFIYQYQLPVWLTESWHTCRQT